MRGIGPVELVVVEVLVVGATWAVCGVVNWTLYSRFTQRFITREEYEARAAEMRAQIADQKHRENIVVQSKILKEVEAIKREANIPPARHRDPAAG